MPYPLPDRLDELKDRVARLTAMVQQAAESAVHAMLTVDLVLARQVFELDSTIDKEEVEVEKLAIDLLALHQSAAGDLRLITSIIKANSDLERIADCAVNISQRVLPLARGSYHVPRDLRVMANNVLSTLRDTIKAFNLSDVNVAHQVIRGDDLVDALYHQIVKDILNNLEQPGVDANVELSNIMIAKNLERMADHCTNIAEDIVYAHTGQIIRHLHVT